MSKVFLLLVEITKTQSINDFVCLKGCLHADIQIEIPKHYSFGSPEEFEPEPEQIAVYCKLMHRNVLKLKTMCTLFVDKRLDKWLK